MSSPLIWLRLPPSGLACTCLDYCHLGQNSQMNSLSSAGAFTRGQEMGRINDFKAAHFHSADMQSTSSCYQHYIAFNLCFRGC